MTSDHHWQEGLTPDPSSYFGFIYELHHMPTGLRYIGKKQFWASSGKSKRRDTNKAGDWKEHHWKPSDWRTYASSSKHVKEMMTDKSEWEFCILSQQTCLRNLNYAEAQQMYYAGVGCLRDLDGELIYLNRKIPEFYGAVDENYDPS